MEEGDTSFPCSSFPLLLCSFFFLDLFELYLSSRCIEGDRRDFFPPLQMVHDDAGVGVFVPIGCVRGLLFYTFVLEDHFTYH